MIPSIVRPALLVTALACASTALADEGAPSSRPAPVSASSTATTASAQHAAPAANGARSEALQLEATQITGNRELPKVMVIVPWKSAEPAELAGRPLNSLVEEVLTPIDRDVMRRTLDYHRLLTESPATAAASEQAARTEPTNQ